MNPFIIDSKGVLREHHNTSFPNTYLAEAILNFAAFYF